MGQQLFLVSRRKKMPGPGMEGSTKAEFSYINRSPDMLFDLRSQHCLKRRNNDGSLEEELS